MDKFIGFRREGLFCAHNKSVEDSLLRQYALSPAIVRGIDANTRLTTWAPWLDTYVLLKNIYQKSYKLSEAITTFALQYDLDFYAKKYCPNDRAKWHCALYDALASALILKHILTQKEFEGVSNRWLLQNSGAKISDNFTLEL